MSKKGDDEFYPFLPSFPSTDGGTPVGVGGEQQFVYYDQNQNVMNHQEEEEEQRSDLSFSNSKQPNAKSNLEKIQELQKTVMMLQSTVMSLQTTVLALTSKVEKGRTVGKGGRVFPSASGVLPKVGGYFFIVNKGTGLTVDNMGQNKNGGGIHAWTEVKGNQNQHWKFVVDGNGPWFYIVSRNTGKTLDLAGGKTNNGAKFHSWDFVKGNANQLFKLKDGGNGFFYFINKKSGKTIDLCSGGRKNGTKIHSWAFVNGNPNQLWKLKDTGVRVSMNTSKFFYIVNKGTGLSVDNKGQKNNGGGIHAWTEIQGNQNQLWKFVMDSNAVGGPWFYIISKNSGRTLDLCGGLTNNGAKFHSWDFGKGNPNQLFKMQDGGNGFFYFINKKSGKTIDLCGGGRKNGTKIHSWGFVSGNPNQLWKLKASAFDAQTAGQFFYLLNKGTGLSVDNKGQKHNGGGIHAWAEVKGNQNQLWKFVLDTNTAGGPWFYIISRNSGKTLDLCGGNTENGAKLHSWEMVKGNPNQLWKLVDAKNGSFYIINKGSNKTLDLCSGGRKNGTKIHSWAYVQGNSNQMWVLKQF